MNRPEQALQRAVAQYLAYQVPAHVGWWTAIGHGGGGKVRGAILKGMGVKAGVPDMMIISNGVTIFLELKAAKGRASSAQSECHSSILHHGAYVYVCRTLDEVAAVLRALGIVRATNFSALPSTQTQSLGR